MKKIILFYFFLFLSQVYGQTNFCTLIESQDFQAKRLLTNNFTTVIDNPLTPLVLNVRINVFNDDDGNNYFNSQTPAIPFGETEFLHIVEILNTKFNRFNIFFKFLGYNFYNSSFITYYNNMNPQLYFNAMNDLCEKDAININFLQQCELPSSPPTATATHSPNYGAAMKGKPTLILSMPAYNGIPSGDIPSLFNPTFDKDLMVCHEMGHVLGIGHPYDPSAFGSCEHVTRDVSNVAVYNANSTGDFIDDTQAQNNFFCDKFRKGGAYDGKLSFISGPNGKDCQGTTFDFDKIIYGNFMTMPFKYKVIYNNFFPDIRTLYFSDGQAAFMRNYIQNPTSGVPGNSLSYVMNNVQSLFKPYKRIKITTPNIISTTDNGNGTARVCRGYYETFLFQPGFTYTFPQNQSPDLNSFTTNETPLISKPTFNCPLSILELNSTQTNLTSNSGLAHTVCRGQICDDELYTQGSLISATSIFSTNISIEMLDKIKMDDPNLYSELLSQYFYKLQKETVTGAKTETIFYKP